MFVTGEKEGAVGAVIELRDADGAAEGPAVLVVAQDLLQAAGAGVGLSGEGIAGVESIVAEEFVQGAVEGVRTAFGDGVDDAPGGLAPFGLEGTGFDAEFLNRVALRHDADFVVDGSGIGHAVEHELVAVGGSAIDAHLGEGLVVDFREAVGGVGTRHHAGNDLHEVEDMAAIQR